MRSRLSVIYRRRWTAVLVFLVIGGLMLYRSARQVPVYEATARILIEADRPNVVGFEDVVDTNRRALDYFQTQYRLLTSRALAQRALESSGLSHEAAFGTPAPVAAPPRETPFNIVRTLFANAPAVATTAPATADATDSPGVRRFLAGLTITPIRNSRLVDVTFASTNPAIAQRAANAIVTAYIEQAADLRNSATKDAASFLTQMLDDQRGEVEQSELALQQYREQGNSIAVEDRGNIVTERLGRLNEALTKARTARIEKETAYKQVRAAAANGDSLDQVPVVRDNPSVQRLKAELADLQRQKTELSQELTERHPTMMKLSASIEAANGKLRDEIAHFVGAVRSEYEAAAALERAMNEAVDNQRSEAVALNRRGLDYGVLQRDADSNRKLYESLLERTKEAGITEQLKSNSVRIVDKAALPRTPARPNRPMDAAVALATALACAFGTVFSLEAFDSRIKSPDEITRRLNLPSLGMVPLCSASSRNGLMINQDVPQNFVEAFKSLRTSILFSTADRGPRSLLVSSTAPGEGKTLVSSNLAMALALSGQRVLIVDADMRRPKVHTVFGLPEEPGLSDVLVGSTSLERAICLTDHDRLQVLPAGTLPPNPPELLGSLQFDQLLEQLGTRYDWVVFDSPPVRAVTDAAVIAHRVNGVVFVIGAEMTDAGAAKVALDRLASARGKITGAVLNRVHLRRHSYYYSQYYGRKDERYYARDRGGRA